MLGAQQPGGAKWPGTLAHARERLKHTLSTHMYQSQPGGGTIGVSAVQFPKADYARLMAAAIHTLRQPNVEKACCTWLGFSRPLPAE